MEKGKKYYGILMIRQSIDPQIFVLKPKYEYASDFYGKYV